MLRSFTVKNYKSIVDVTVELGRFNLFIGENGCGKSNLLESLAMAALSSSVVTNEALITRGVRPAPPSLLRNAFVDATPPQEVSLTLQWNLEDGETNEQQFLLGEENGRWINRWPERTLGTLLRGLERAGVAAEDVAVLAGAAEIDRLPPAQTKKLDRLLDRIQQALEADPEMARWSRLIDKRHEYFSPYAIYCASTLALRGLQTESHREPLGLYGEGLDVAFASLAPETQEQLIEYARLISWLDDIDLDTSDVRKLKGFTPSRSRSKLYFHDRFLDEKNRYFSAENANEGILHVLFWLVLFSHPEAPKFFAIDNIESALNPHLLRHLIKTLAQLSKDNDRQALVTTHNPAALDGLNLHDEEQRLFVVSRNDEGHTQVRRVQVKPEHQLDGKKLKLSELWMRGMLGGIPTNF